MEQGAGGRSVQEIGEVFNGSRRERKEAGERTSTRTGEGRTSKDGRQTETRPGNEKELSGLVDGLKPELVEIEVPEELPEKPKSKRGRKKQTTETKDLHLSENLKLLIELAFNLIALPAGRHWRLTEIEAMTIAQPAGHILEKHAGSKIVSEYGDYVSLAGAIITVVLPRIMISYNLKNKQKKEQTGKEVKKEENSIINDYLTAI